MPGAENLAAGEGGADCGELGYMLRGAGARRKRSAWVVATAAKTSGRQGEKASASPSPCVFGSFFFYKKRNVTHLEIGLRVKFSEMEGVF